MKSTPQKHPRLYINIFNKINNNHYDVEYYENEYEIDGSLKRKSGKILNLFLCDIDSNQKKLYDLNKKEYQLLINLIKKQQKVSKIYLNKNKLEQFNIISTSLELLRNYKKLFLKWFSDNEILQ